MKSKNTAVEKEGRKKWYAVYTKSRWEKKVHVLFQLRGIESYCPLNKVSKKWSDRTKLVEEPLFKSYVFVRVSEADQSKVRLVEGVINYVYWQGKPAVIKDREISDIRRFLNEYQDVRIENLDLKPDSKVIIRGGVLMDKEARVIRVLGHEAEVVIESLGYKLVAKIEKTNLISIQ
jgi:transcription antitermination factor NusG